jgi:hypothetical protein
LKDSPGNRAKAAARQRALIVLALSSPPDQQRHGAIGGTLALFVSGAAALAPVGAGLAYQFAGGYAPVFLGLAAASALAAVAMLGLGRWP